MTQPGNVLAELLAPFSVDEFLRTHWEGRALHRASVPSSVGLLEPRLDLAEVVAALYPTARRAEVAAKLQYIDTDGAHREVPLPAAPPG